MLRTLLCFIAFALSSVAQAAPLSLYKGSGPPDEKSTVAIVVAVDHYYNHFELDDVRDGVKEKGLSWSQELAQWEDVTHVLRIEGASARKGEILKVIGQMPKVQRIIFVWIGLGALNDTGAGVLFPSDVKGDNLEESALRPDELKEPLAEHAQGVDIILDATPDEGSFMGLATLAPDATAFKSGSCSSCWVLSSTKGSAYAPEGDGFTSEMLSLLASHREQKTPITYGEILATLLTSNWVPDYLYQGVNSSDTFLEHPAPPMVSDISTPVLIGTPDPLPTKPVITKEKSKVKPLAVAFGVGAAGALGYGIERAAKVSEIEAKVNKAPVGKTFTSETSYNEELQEQEMAGWTMVGSFAAAAALLGVGIVVQF